MDNPPLRVAIIGMGGFAGDHHRSIHALEQQGACRLVCTCDPAPDSFVEARERWKFAARGVEIFTDYRAMLEAHRDGLDIVTVPTPIPLHAPMHRACVEHDMACYLEKPPTLDHAELKQMLAVEDRARKQTQVGFNFIVEAERQTLKMRILNGDFGHVRRVSFLGMAPRATTYFNRSAWAGRLMMEDRLVLDSVIGNAVSHYLHNLLFWAGQEWVLAWKGVDSMEAELYRAHAIEGMDTVFARGMCENGIEVRVAATHACEGEHLSQETIECEHASIQRANSGPFVVQWKDGKHETLPVQPRDLLVENFLAYFRYVRGDSPRPVSRLVDTRPFVEFYDLAYVAAKQIARVDAEHVTRLPTADGTGEFVAIRDIRAACDRFLSTAQLPSEQGIVWAWPGGKATLNEIDQLRSVVERMTTLSNGPRQ